MAVSATAVQRATTASLLPSLASGPRDTLSSRILEPLRLREGFQGLVLSRYTSFLFSSCCQLAEMVPNKVHRRHGYEAPPFRVGLRALVQHAL